MTYKITDSKNIRLFTYKQKRMEAGYTDTVHHYDELKFVRVLEGKGIWHINDTDYSVTAGDIILFSAADVRSLTEIVTAPLVIEQVCFIPAFLTPVQQAADFFYRRRKNFSHLLPREKRLNDYMDALVQEVVTEQPYKEQALHSTLCALVIAAARLMQDGAQGGLAPDRRALVAHAEQYIRGHFAQELHLAEIAAKFYLSPAYFSRLFRAGAGLSFGDYLARVRVGETIRLMEREQINILDAALACGFTSSSGFYRTFRRITGTTPKHFK